jgi:biopolymer transport protein TolR
MKRRSPKRGLNQELNVTNLVDVTFAILVVFMITAPLMTKGIKVDLPKTEAPKMEDPQLLRVSIDKEEKFYIADVPVEVNEFNQTFLQQWDGEVAVIVNSDAEVPYGTVMKVVSRIQALGVVKVGFLTQQGTLGSR